MLVSTVLFCGHVLDMLRACLAAVEEVPKKAKFVPDQLGCQLSTKPGNVSAGKVQWPRLLVLPYCVFQAFRMLICQAPKIAPEDQFKKEHVLNSFLHICAVGLSSVRQL